MDSFDEKVLAFTGSNQLILPSERVLVAVSGGADSMVLLSLLCRWPQPGLPGCC